VLYTKKGVQRGGSTGGSEIDHSDSKGKENQPGIQLSNRPAVVLSGGKRPATASIKSAKEKSAQAQRSKLGPNPVKPQISYVLKASNIRP